MFILPKSSFGGHKLHQASIIISCSRHVAMHSNVFVYEPKQRRWKADSWPNQHFRVLRKSTGLGKPMNNVFILLSMSRNDTSLIIIRPTGVSENSQSVQCVHSHSVCSCLADIRPSWTDFDKVPTQSRQSEPQSGVGKSRKCSSHMANYFACYHHLVM